MSLFGQTKRHAPPTPKGRRSPLPMFAGADEKRFYPSSSSTDPSSSGIFTTIYLPIPRIPFLSSSEDASTSRYDYQEKRSKRVRYVRVCLPIPPRLYARLPRPTRPLRAALVGLLVLGVMILLLGLRRRPGGGPGWSPPFSEPDSLVLTQEEVAAIWEWEVLSGHHPSIQQRMYPLFSFLSSLLSWTS
jgi:WD repeat and SOF domain-containing protein 1